MQLFQKICLFFGGAFFAVFAVGEGDSPTAIGFRVDDNPVTSVTSKAAPPGRIALFHQEQEYEACLPVGMGTGFYYASSFSMNRSEQVEMYAIYLRISPSEFDDAPQLRHVELLKGLLKRERAGKWQDGDTTAAALYDETVARESRQNYGGGEGWYVYSVDQSKIKSFVEIYPPELKCNETLNRLEWEDNDLVTEYSTRGHITLFMEDGVLKISGEVQRYRSLFGYALDEWGYKGSEINFMIRPLVGQKYERPRSEAK